MLPVVDWLERCLVSQSEQLKWHTYCPWKMSYEQCFCDLSHPVLSTTYVRRWKLQLYSISSFTGASTSLSDLASDITKADTPCHSALTTFDENKPIAASGAYNIEFFAVEPTSHALTRSLSLQGGELDNSGLLDGSASGGFRPHSESFSVGTESAPGTLRRPKKVRPGSVKKKPLLRQNSNPESPRPASTISTPEIKKRAKPQTASPLQAQEETEGGSATPSPGGTLRRARKSCVETPPPLPEETNHTSQEESRSVPALPLCQEEIPLPVSLTDKDESPIPPSASYKWDPENFENINPFNTGGSKIWLIVNKSWMKSWSSHELWKEHQRAEDGVGFDTM